jgi:hypothetical protein
MIPELRNSPLDVVAAVEVQREVHYLLHAEPRAAHVAAAAVDAVLAVVDADVGEQDLQQRHAAPVRRVAVADARSLRAADPLRPALAPLCAAAAARRVVLGRVGEDGQLLRDFHLHSSPAVVPNIPRKIAGGDARRQSFAQGCRDGRKRVFSRGREGSREEARGDARRAQGRMDARRESDWATCRPPAGANEFAAGTSRSPPARTRRPGRGGRSRTPVRPQPGIPRSDPQSASFAATSTKSTFRGRTESTPRVYGENLPKGHAFTPSGRGRAGRNLALFQAYEAEAAAHPECRKDARRNR